MKLVTETELKAEVTKYLRLARKEDVIVTHYGKVSARWSPLSQDDFEEYLFESDPRFIAFMRRSQREHERNRDGIPLEDVYRRLGLSLPRAKPRKRASREK